MICCFFLMLIVLIHPAEFAFLIPRTGLIFVGYFHRLLVEFSRKQVGKLKQLSKWNLFELHEPYCCLFWLLGIIHSHCHPTMLLRHIGFSTRLNLPGFVDVLVWKVGSFSECLRLFLLRNDVVTVYHQIGVEPNLPLKNCNPVLRKIFVRALSTLYLLLFHHEQVESILHGILSPPLKFFSDLRPTFAKPNELFEESQIFLWPPRSFL